MSRRYVIEVEVPDFQTVQKATADMVTRNPNVVLKNVQRGSVQDIIDSVPFTYDFEGAA